MSNPTPIIRDVVLSDLPQISKLSRNQRIFPEFSSIKKIRKYLSTPPHNQGKLLVVYVGKQIVGISEVILGLYGPRGGYIYKPSYGSLIKFFIIPSMDKIRTMTKLLHASERSLIKMGAFIIFTNINQYAVKRQQFLEKHGYEVVQRWKWGGRLQQRLKKIVSGK